MEYSVNKCKQAGWIDPNFINAWSQGGYYTRLVRDTMDYWISLHQHFMSLASSGANYQYVWVEIQHHIDELDLIRQTQDSRLQAMCAIYAYLRDGHKSSWQKPYSL